MKFLESVKINRDQFAGHCKWHQCSVAELEEFYEGNDEDKPIYLWKWGEVRPCPGRPKFIRAKNGPVVWVNFELKEVVEEGVFADADRGLFS